MNNFDELLTELETDPLPSGHRPSAFGGQTHKQLSPDKLHSSMQKVNHARLADRIENSAKPVMIYGIPGIGKTVGVVNQAKRKAAESGRLFVSLNIAAMAETQERTHERSIAAIDVTDNTQQVSELVSIIDILENTGKYYILLQGRPPEMHPLLFAGIPSEEEKWSQTTDKGIADQQEEIKGVIGAIGDAISGSKDRKQKKLENEENNISDLYMEAISPGRVITTLSQPSPFLDLILAKPGGPYADAMGTIFLDELTRVDDSLFFNLIMARLEPGSGYNNRQWKFVAAGNYGSDYAAQVIEDPAIKNRFNLVELEHDPIAWMSFATDQMIPPLHNHIRDFIKNPKYKPFDKQYRLKRGHESPIDWHCCYDTSFDQSYHGKTYAKPKTKEQVDSALEDAREYEGNAGTPEDEGDVDCYTGCIQNQHLINLLTPRDIERLNSGGGLLLSNGDPDDYKHAVAKVQEDMADYYNERDELDKSGEEQPEGAKELKYKTKKTPAEKAEILDLLFRKIENKQQTGSLQILGKWAAGKLDNGPWVSAFMAYVKNQVDVEQGSSGTEDIYQYKTARSSGFDQELESSMHTLFRYDDKVTTTSAVKFYNILDPKALPMIRVNPGQCNLLKSAICKFMQFEAEAGDISPEEHNIIAGKIYKVLLAAQSQREYQSFEKTHIMRSNQQSNDWSLYGLTDSTLTTLFKWVYVIDKFRVHFSSHAEARARANPDLEDEEEDDFFAGDLSLPGSLPGQQGSGSKDMSNNPEFVNGLCINIVDKFLENLSKEFNATNLQLGEKKPKQKKSKPDPGTKLPEPLVTGESSVPYGVATYGQDKKPRFLIDKSSGFQLHQVSKGNDPEILNSGQVTPEIAFVAGGRAIIACLIDLAKVVCPEKSKKLVELDELFRRVLLVHGNKPDPEEEVFDPMAAGHLGATHATLHGWPGFPENE